MDRNQIIAEIKGNLQKINQILTLIENYDNTNSTVELDLLQKNSMLLFENYVRLKLSYEMPETIIVPALPNKNIVKEVVSPVDVKAPQAVKETPKKSFGFNFNLGDDEGKINQNMESLLEEKVENKPEFNLEKAINEALNIALNKSADAVNDDNNRKPVFSNQDKDLSLNERFSSMKTEENLADKHLNTPISDLSKEISLNKKFAFVNELFGGNMDNYNKAIEQLNKVGSLEYATKYINELRATLRWNRESAVVADFIDLVERRWE